MRAYYSDHHSVPLPSGHRFPMEKYRRVREELVARGVLHLRQLRPAELVDREILLRVHRPEYVGAVFDGTLSASQQRELGFP